MNEAMTTDPIAEIIRKHLEFELSLKTSLTIAIELGELLTKQKEGIEHGSFTTWVEQNLPFSVRTAQNYMKLFNKREILEEAKPKDITTAYLMITPKKEKAPVVSYAIVDDDEEDEEFVDIETEPAESIPHTQSNIFNYWKDLEPLIQKMLFIHRKLAALRNSTTPTDLGNMIGNIKDMAIVLETWNPSLLRKCTVCNGKGCAFCLNGKTGMSKESDY